MNSNDTNPSSLSAQPAANQPNVSISSISTSSFKRPQFKPSTFHLSNGCSRSTDSSSSSSSSQTRPLSIPANVIKHINPFSSSLITCFDVIAKRVSLEGRSLRIALTFLEFMSLTQLECTDRLHAESKESQQAWSTCCIYMSTVVVANETLYQNLPPDPSSPPLPTLTHLLLVSKMKVDEFLHHLQHSYKHCIASLRTHATQPILDIRGIDRMEASVTNVQSTLLRAIASYAKYTKLYQQLIQPRLDSLPVLSEEPGFVELFQKNLFGGGWLLFVVCKNSLAVNGSESHSIIAAMFAVVRIVLFNVVMVEHELAKSVNSTYPSRVADALTMSLDLVSQACADVRMPVEAIRSSINQLDVQWMQPMLKQFTASRSIQLPVSSQTFNQSSHLATSSPITGHPYEIFSLSVYGANITELGLILDVTYPKGQQGIGFDDRIFLRDLYSNDDLANTDTVAHPTTTDVNPIVRTASIPHSTRRLFTAENPSPDDANLSPVLTASSDLHDVQPSLSSTSMTTIQASPECEPDASGSSTPTTVQNSPAFSPAIRTPLSRTTCRSLSPFSRGLQATSWVVSSYANTCNTPSNELKAILSRYTPDITQNIRDVIDTLADSVKFPDWSASDAPLKRSLTKKVYYSLLYNLLMDEFKLTPRDLTNGPRRQSLPQVPQWITRRSLHATLLALCFEVVRSAYQPADISVPIDQIFLDPSTVSKPLFQLSWLDYFRCFDPILNYLPGMPRSLTERLLALELIVIESKVWSPREKVPEMMQDDEVRAALRQAVGMEPVVLSSHGTSSPSSASLPPEYSLLLQLIRRQLECVSEKLSLLCEPESSILDDDIHPTVRTAIEYAIWAMFSECMFNHPTLFINRHIDTILLCCTYAIVAKVTTITDSSRSEPRAPRRNDHFRRLVSIYSREFGPNMDEVVKRVRMIADPTTPEEAANHSTIIQFYNFMFVAVVKDFALDRCKSYIQQVMNNPAAAPPTWLHAAHRPLAQQNAVVEQVEPNIFVSPFTTEPNDEAVACVHSTPVRKPMASPAFTMTIGLSPSRDVQAINSALHSSITDLPPLEESPDDEEDNLYPLIEENEEEVDSSGSSEALVSKAKRARLE